MNMKYPNSIPIDIIDNFIGHPVFSIYKNNIYPILLEVVKHESNINEYICIVSEENRPAYIIDGKYVHSLYFNKIKDKNLFKVFIT